MASQNLQPPVGNTASGPHRTIWIPQHDGLSWRGSQNPNISVNYPSNYGYGADPHLHQMPFDGFCLPHGYAQTPVR
jgi:hypothetical protein